MRPSTGKLLEICIASVEDAIVAERGGADRIEVNLALELGGLTPSPRMVRTIRDHFSGSIQVMLRPRPGGFAYSDREFQLMRFEVDELLEAGADGVVFGLIDLHQQIDTRRSEQLLQQIIPREAVFHRAFDLITDQSTALETLIQLGFNRILTSGGKPTAIEGLDQLRKLQQQSAGRIEILPAAGIHPRNISRLLDDFDQFHASLRTPISDGSIPPNGEIQFSAQPGNLFFQTDLGLVQQIREILNAVNGVDR